MTALRFGFFTTFYPPYSFGGDGIGVRRLAHGLVARGCRVTVVHERDAFRALNRGPEPAGPLEEPEGLDVVGLESRLGRLSLLLTHQLGRPVVHGRRLAALIRNGGFDLLAFHNVSLIGGPGLLAYGGNLPRIYLAHEHWLVCQSHTLWRHNRELCTGRQCLRCTWNYRRPPQLWRWTGHLERHLRHVDTFVAMSRFSREKHREFGFPAPMEVLPYFLPAAQPNHGPDASASPHPRPFFLFVGRLERLKGLDQVIPLFESYCDADLVVAGEGEHGEALRRLASANARVRFLGRLDPGALEPYYRHAIALIVPSVCYETFGIIVLEAFRHGTPVIARRLGPLPEIVTGSGGGETFGTSDELVQAMRALQSDPGRRRDRGDAAFRAFHQHYSDTVVVPRFLDLAMQAIDRRRRRTGDGRQV